MYSQNKEEEYILRICADAPRRTLLDIGAWHPTQMSNSRALIEQGWGAVLVEPSPGPLRSLIVEYGGRSGINIISAAVTMVHYHIELQVTDDGVTAECPTKQWLQGNKGGYYGSFWAVGITLDELIQGWLGDRGCDFVSIDTEGTSVDIFKQLLRTEMLPRCICVEHDNRIIEAVEAAQARGYRQAYASRENLVFEMVGT